MHRKTTKRTVNSSVMTITEYLIRCKLLIFNE